MKKITFLFFLITFVWGVKAQVNYETNFDSDTAGDIPQGWTSYTTQSDDPGFSVISDSSLAHSVPNFLGYIATDLSQRSEAWIVSPAINVGSREEVVFYWRIKWAFAYDYSGVYISSGSNDPIANPDDFTELKEFNPDSISTWNQWNKETFSLIDYEGQTIYIAFKYAGDFAHDFYVDDFLVQRIPYCNPPLDFEAASVTETSITVSWSPSPDCEQYEVVWGEAGIDPDSTENSAITHETAYTITGLEPSTLYDIYVRAVCRPYNMSSWSGPVSVRTLGPPPVNDTCGGAIEIPVTPDCQPIYVDNYNTTDSGVEEPPCAYYNGSDVWFKVAVPDDGSLTVETLAGNSGEIYDTGMAVYSGDCDNLELLECNDDGGEGYFSKIYVSGQTPGDTLYVRVWEYGGNAFGEFGICAYNPNVNVQETDVYEFTLYPNPVSDQLIYGAKEVITHLQIADINGRIIYELEPNIEEGKVNVRNLTPGIYFIYVQINDKKGIYRFIKQ